MSSLIFLVNCTVKPPDIPICRRLKGKWVKDQFGIASLRANPICAKEVGEKECGFCVWTLSDKRQYVGEKPEFHLYGKPWSLILTEAIIVPSESYAKMKSYIVKACKQARCDKEVSRWRVKLDSLDSAGPDVSP